MDYFFETEHLRARRFAADDAQPLYKYHLEENVKRWIPNESYADIEEAQRAIDYYIGCVSNRHLPYVLADELKETGELIGDTGINEVEGQGSKVEIGYVISGKYSGRGLATELLNAMTEFVFSSFETDVIYARVLRGNYASTRVLEKNGYVFVEEELGAEDDPYGNGVLIFKKECS